MLFIALEYSTFSPEILYQMGSIYCAAFIDATII
jgi:hypothetical protein